MASLKKVNAAWVVVGKDFLGEEFIEGAYNTRDYAREIAKQENEAELLYIPKGYEVKFSVKKFTLNKETK